MHKLTTHLTENCGRIVIEDLNVRGMMQNHCLAKTIADLGLHEFRRQLEYKSQLSAPAYVCLARARRRPVSSRRGPAFKTLRWQLRTVS